MEVVGWEEPLRLEDFGHLVDRFLGLFRSSLIESAKPERDCAKNGSTAVGERELVVSRGQSAPLLGAVEAAFDHVALPVIDFVVADRPSAARTTSSAVALLECPGVSPYPGSCPPRAPGVWQDVGSSAVQPCSLSA